MNSFIFLLGIFLHAEKQQGDDISDCIHWEGDIIQKTCLTPASDTIFYSVPVQRSNTGLLH